MIIPDGNGWGWELPIDGSSPRPIPVGDPRSYDVVVPWMERRIAYSPDGTRAAAIADAALLGTAPPYQLILMAANGSQQRVVLDTAEDLNSVHWSPTDDLIAFVETRQPSMDALKLLDVDTGAISTLIEPVEDVSINLIGFSPDGAWLMYTVQGDVPGEMPSVWIAATDGSGAQMVVEGASVAGWVVLP